MFAGRCPTHKPLPSRRERYKQWPDVRCGRSSAGRSVEANGGGKKESQTSTRCPKFTWRSQSAMFVFDSRSACFLGRRLARARESHGKVCRRRRRHFLIHGKHVHSYTRCCNLANQTECFRNHLDLSRTYIWLTGRRELFFGKGEAELGRRRDGPSVYRIQLPI